MHLRALACAVTLGTATQLLLVAPVTAQSSSSSSSSSDSRPDPTPWAPGVSEGLVVNLIGDVLGPGVSEHIGVLAGDLGIMTAIGTGREFAIIFGDSFRGARFGEGEWLSPVGVVAEFDEAGRIIIKRALNEGEKAQQLLNYSHNDRGLTLLPSDVINIDGTLYMQGMWNEGVGNVLRTQIWKSENQGASWQSLGTIPASYLGGKAQLITWELGPDGYVYMMSSGFQRRDDVYLTRFLPGDIGDRSKWSHFSLAEDGTGSWGGRVSPVLSERVSAGEMSLRYIEGHWVLAMFNAETMAIEIRISSDIAIDWNSVPVANVVVAGTGGWGSTQNPDNFTQLYGGYIAPGSTLGNMDLIVSQWNTSNNSRYMSTQFNVKGLDTYFGINQGPQTRSLRTAPGQAGDPGVLQVEQVPIDATTAGPDTDTAIAEGATDILLVPMGDSPAP